MHCDARTCVHINRRIELGKVFFKVH
ncbi:hypothetical protein J2W27_001661 [Variovorax boronicumulans]|nr:hypothetical protein [Variovorax boronicumulans]